MRSQRYYLRVEPDGRRTFYGPYGDEEVSGPAALQYEAQQLGATLYVTRATDLYLAMTELTAGARA